jgi:hypothetical protein
MTTSPTQDAQEGLSASACSVIGRISVCVEVSGRLCFVALPHDRLMLLINLAASLSDNGKLPVVKAPDGFRFEHLHSQNNKLADNG